MGKLLVAIVFTVLLVGVLLYMGNTKVAPAVVTKSTSINTSITGESVSTTTGIATGIAP
jgi:hypothetical protein